jgi:hypothetical protein
MIFHDGTTVHFGSKEGETYIDHNNEKKKKNYIKRHQLLNEDWSDPYSPGALSRFILWEKKTLDEALKAFKYRFNIK